MTGGNDDTKENPLLLVWAFTAAKVSTEVYRQLEKVYAGL